LQLSTGSCFLTNGTLIFWVLLSENRRNNKNIIFKIFSKSEIIYKNVKCFLEPGKFRINKSTLFYTPKNMPHAYSFMDNIGINKNEKHKNPDFNYYLNI